MSGRRGRHRPWAASAYRGLAVLCALALLPVSQVSAATLTTSSTCSLTDAVTSAHNNSDTGNCVAVGAYTDHDTINLHANQTPPAPNRLVGAHTITINGNGRTIDMNQGGPHFTLTAGVTLNLKNISLTGGRATYGSIHVADNLGHSTLNITNSRLCGNEATSSGGAIRVSGNSILNVSNSVFCNNTAHGSGGAIMARGGSGGGNTKTITITNSTFYGNRAKSLRACHQLVRPPGRLFCLAAVYCPGQHERGERP